MNLFRHKRIEYFQIQILMFVKIPESALSTAVILYFSNIMVMFL